MTSQRPIRASTPALLKDLRSLKVLVMHPDDGDGRELTQQLTRIGCQVQAVWPPLPTLPEGVDAVFLAVRPGLDESTLAWARGEETPILVAVVTYENPTIVGLVLRLGAKAVLPSPVRSFGVLSALVLARKVAEDLKETSKHVNKLQAKLLSHRRIADAKSILMRTRGIGETEAYELIREQAMSRRRTTEEIALSIVNANEILTTGWSK